MHQDHCPQCGGPLECLSGVSAHPDNWHCTDEKNCGWRAWEARAASARRARRVARRSDDSMTPAEARHTLGICREEMAQAIGVHRDTWAK
jgi:hypothetical protein